MTKRQTFAISFLCRPSKVNRDGYAPVEVSIVINGTRTYLKLQRKERPEVWQKAMESKRDNELKVYKEMQISRIHTIVDEMAAAGIELTASALKECVKRGGVVVCYTLGMLWRDIMDNKDGTARLGDIQAETARRYGRAKAAFYDANGFNDDTPADIVELQHIHNLQQHLREDMGQQQCTAYNYHARVKAAFTLAFERGKIKSNPYAGFRMNKGEAKGIVFLTNKELRTISQKPLVGRLEKVRDLFLFQCYSGLSFSDMACLGPLDYQKVGSAVVIQKQRIKTGVAFKSMVLQDGIRILEKYNYQLPRLSNVKCNAYLKEIQTVCGISKTLHTHLGRTTYICLLYNKGLNPTTIAEVVGHSTAKTTLKYYAKMDTSTIIGEFRQKRLLPTSTASETPKKKSMMDYIKLATTIKRI